MVGTVIGAIVIVAIVIVAIIVLGYYKVKRLEYLGAVGESGGNRDVPETKVPEVATQRRNELWNVNEFNSLESDKLS